MFKNSEMPPLELYIAIIILLLISAVPIPAKAFQGKEGVQIFFYIGPIAAILLIFREVCYFSHKVIKKIRLK